MHVTTHHLLNYEAHPNLFSMFFKFWSKKMPEYAGKLCLAPMVRSGELPMRLMALKYGADLVWSPEIIDRKIRTCTRIDNTELGTVDFVETGKTGQKNSLIFRTNREIEKGKLIFQLGSSDPQIAVEGALKVANDVDGIDLNCGCPKPFSTHSGMGAALLSKPELLTLILSNLVEKVGKPYDKPISCKIRLLDPSDPKPTLDLVEKICATGVANLTVHCRTRDMRNRQQPIREFVQKIFDITSKHGVSLVVNGGFLCKKEIVEFQKTMGNDKIGGMMAEAAELNPTVFSDSPLPWKDVLPEFIRTSISVQNHPSNTKYILLNQVPGKSKFYQMFCKVKTNEEFLEIANQIGDEGKNIFIRIMQKDKQYSQEELEGLFSKKRPVEEKTTTDKKQRVEYTEQSRSLQKRTDTLVHAGAASIQQTS